MTRAGAITGPGNRSGHTRLTQNALRKTVEAITAQAFRVSGSNVKAELEDDSGRLGVKISVQLQLPPLLNPAETAVQNTAAQGTVFDQAQAARTELVARGRQLTGMEVGRVDIRLTGARQGQTKERRVQ